MSGHSKWSKVKQFKGAIDARRSASFTKLAREITIAVREGGSYLSFNFKLRIAIDRAKKGSMPKESIDRAIARGAGTGQEGALESLVYEAYAPGGTALIIECLTDNRNRTAGDVKYLLSKNGSSLASTGSVIYLFNHNGVIQIPGGIPENNRDQIECALIDAGANEIKKDDDIEIVICASKDLAGVTGAIEQHGVGFESAEIEWLPKITIDTQEEDGLALEKLLDALDALDDVSRVYTNAA